MAVVAVGTCATYGGIHAMAGNPTGAMGVPDYLGWDWKSKAGIPIVCVPGCPIHPDNLAETLTYLLYMATGQAPMIPLDEALRPQWLFGQTVHEGCDRAGYYEQGVFADEYGAPTCIVKLGCWGPVVNCNVPKRGWINGVGGCPNVGGICIGCTMPGFPDKFMPFMDEPPGGKLSSGLSKGYGGDDPSPARRDQQDVERGTEVAQAGPRAAHRDTGAEEERRHDAPTREPNQRAAAPTVDDNGIVEMAWDPITRIVGSLGIYTKIDWKQRVVKECKSTSSIFRGYSIFMKGKDPRDAHFITSRICGICGDNHATCACYAQNMAFGVKPPHDRRVDRQPRRGRRIHVRPQHLPGEPGRSWTSARRWSRETNPGGLGEGQGHRGAARGDPRLQARSATSSAPSTRSRARSTARRCRSAGGRARCSA